MSTETHKFDVREVSFGNEVIPCVSRFDVFNIYSGVLAGNPSEARFRMRLFERGNNVTQKILGEVPCLHLSLISDFDGKSDLPEYWHTLELSTTQCFDFDSDVDDSSLIDRAYAGFSWLASEPTFCLNPLQARRMLQFDWVKNALLVSDLFGLIERKTDE